MKAEQRRSFTKDLYLTLCISVVFDPLLLYSDGDIIIITIIRFLVLCWLCWYYVGCVGITLVVIISLNVDGK